MLAAAARLGDPLVERRGAGADRVALAPASPNPRGDSRITTPGTPPSRTIRLEPTPTG